jgi:hypothetical protein
MKIEEEKMKGRGVLKKRTRREVSLEDLFKKAIARIRAFPRKTGPWFNVC